MKEYYSFLVFLLLLLSIAQSGCLSLREAYVPRDLLTDGWYEDFEDEEKGSGLLGMEKWSTKVYRKGDTAYLSVTSLRFIILHDKEKLLEKVDADILNQAVKYGINMNYSSRINGKRETCGGHETVFVVYTGEKDGHEYRFIGEVWSCSKSGISVICMGYADVSEIDGIRGWKEMVEDPEGTIEGLKGENGLIYNVVCH